MSVNVGKLNKEIKKFLEEYSDEMAEVVKNTVSEVAKETNVVIKKHVRFKNVTGKYVKSFRVKKSYENKFNKRMTWYVASPEYRLSHLLEYGHKKRNNKGRTKPFMHITYGRNYVRENLEKRIKEDIEKWKS